MAEKITTTKGYMEEVARMLGVELGEEFTLEDDETNGKYVIYADGVHEIKSDTEISALHVGLLNALLIGGQRIKEKPFYPKGGQIMYCIDISSRKAQVVETQMNIYSPTACAMRLAGVVYRTRELAEKHRAEDFEKLTGCPLSAAE